MDGIHDLGGMEGFGAVVREADEPVFHESWQESAFCLLMTSSVVLSGTNADEYRHSVERMAPDHYLRAHSYERMFTGVATLFVEGGCWMSTISPSERADGFRWRTRSPTTRWPTSSPNLRRGSLKVTEYASAR